MEEAISIEERSLFFSNIEFFIPRATTSNARRKRPTTTDIHGAHQHFHHINRIGANNNIQNETVSIILMHKNRGSYLMAPRLDMTTITRLSAEIGAILRVGAIAVFGRLRSGGFWDAVAAKPTLDHRPSRCKRDALPPQGGWPLAALSAGVISCRSILSACMHANQPVFSSCRRVRCATLIGPSGQYSSSSGFSGPPALRPRGTDRYGAASWMNPITLLF